MRFDNAGIPGGHACRTQSGCRPVSPCKRPGWRPLRPGKCGKSRESSAFHCECRQMAVTRRNSEPLLPDFWICGFDSQFFSIAALSQKPLSTLFGLLHDTHLTEPPCERLQARKFMGSIGLALVGERLGDRICLLQLRYSAS